MPVFRLIFFQEFQQNLFLFSGITSIRDSCRGQFEQCTKLLWRSQRKREIRYSFIGKRRFLFFFNFCIRTRNLHIHDCGFFSKGEIFLGREKMNKLMKKQHTLERQNITLQFCTEKEENQIFFFTGRIISKPVFPSLEKKVELHWIYPIAERKKFVHFQRLEFTSWNWLWIGVK